MVKTNFTSSSQLFRRSSRIIADIPMARKVFSRRFHKKRLEKLTPQCLQSVRKNVLPHVTKAPAKFDAQMPGNRQGKKSLPSYYEASREDAGVLGKRHENLHFFPKG